MRELGKDRVEVKGVDLSFMHKGTPPPPKGPTPPPPAEQQEPVADAPDPAAADENQAHAEEPPTPPTRQEPDPEPDPGGDDETPPPAAEPLADKVKPIIAYVPVKTRDKLRKVATATGRSFTDVLFDAVDELDAQLPQVFAGHLAAAPEQSLFSRRSRRATTSVAAAQGVPVQVPFRPYAVDLAVLDERAAEYAAGNRSEFIRIVLQTYLSR